MGTGNPENRKTSKTLCDIAVLSQNVEKHKPGEVITPCGWSPRLRPQIHQKSDLKNTPEKEPTGHPKVSPRSSQIDKNPEKVASRNDHQKNTRNSAENDPLRPSKTMVSHWRGCKNHKIQESPKGTKNTSKTHPQINLKSQKIVTRTPPKHSLKNTLKTQRKTDSKCAPKATPNPSKID